MNRSIYRHHCFLVVLCVLLFSAKTTAQTETKDILIGVDLTEGFDMGVDTSKQKRDWLTQLKGECFIMSFPADQKWAAVFITYGEPKDPPRPSIDLSAYRTLYIEMKGATGGEKVEVGIKSNSQADNGRERKITVVLTPKWEAYTFSLDR